MKVIILQGEDEIRARERLFSFIREAKKRNWIVERIGENGLLSEKLSLGALYFQGSLLIVEDYRLINKRDIDFINKNYRELEDVVVICAFGEVVSQSLLKKLPRDIKIENFDYPKIIFNFLDSISSGDCRKVLYLLREVLSLKEKYPPELVFHLLFTRIRDLYWIKVCPYNLPYKFRQMYFLKKQASFFTKGKLKDIINFLADIDIEAKMSNLGIDFYLDLVVLKYLK